MNHRFCHEGALERGGATASSLFNGNLSLIFAYRYDVYRVPNAFRHQAPRRFMHTVTFDRLPDRETFRCRITRRRKNALAFCQGRTHTHRASPVNTPSASESPPIEEQTRWFIDQVHPH